MRLPIDILLGQAEKEDGRDEWVKTHTRRLQDAYLKAREQLRRQAEARKATYDRRAKAAPLQLGDRVYLRHRVLGRNKIQDHWAPRVYKVIQVLNPEQGVYQVEPSDGSGPIRTVNRTEI